jgi:hypothetical protein
MTTTFWSKAARRWRLMSLEEEEEEVQEEEELELEIEGVKCSEYDVTDEAQTCCLCSANSISFHDD